ncbi:MAG: cytochrome P450, partial [Myxococcota bacterium]
HRSYVKSKNYRELRRIMGEGLVTYDGPTWVDQRRRVQPAFTRAAVAELRPRLERSARRFVESLAGGEQDLTAPINEVSSRLTNQVLFGVEGRRPGRLHGWIETVSEAAVARIYEPVAVPRWISTKRRRDEQAAIDAIDEEVRALFRDRQGVPNRQGVLDRQSVPDRQSVRGQQRVPNRVSVLNRVSVPNRRSVRGQKSGAPSVSCELVDDAVIGLPRSLRDQLVTLLLTGQDTLAAALKWFVLTLADHPELQFRIGAEAQTERGEAPLAKAVLFEVLRLYPPIPVVARTPVEERRLGEFAIPAGSVVLCCIEALHRHPAHWSEPARFMPERFLNASSHRAYLPFSAGPRRCIGAQLAVVQCLAVIKALFARFEVHRPSEAVVSKTTITLSPRAVRVALKPRRAVPTYPPESLRLPDELEAGGYRVRFAQSEADLLRVQRLRYRVFNRELGCGLRRSDRTELDADRFDRTSHHLLVESKAGDLVGTYRLRPPKASGGYYSEGDFELCTLPREVLQEGVEIGRACIASPDRNGRVLLLLWKGLARYLQAAGCRYLFGCSSIPGVDPKRGWGLYRRLEAEGHVHSKITVLPTSERCLPRSPSAAAFEPPLLLAGYLRQGARVCSPPALDREFRAISYFTLLDVDELPARSRRRLFSGRGWRAECSGRGWRAECSGRGWRAE